MTPDDLFLIAGRVALPGGHAEVVLVRRPDAARRQCLAQTLEVPVVDWQLPVDAGMGDALAGAAQTQYLGR